MVKHEKKGARPERKLGMGLCLAPNHLYFLSRTILENQIYFSQTNCSWSMERSSQVSIATFGPRIPGSNPSWFAISNSNQKLSIYK